MDFTYGSSSFDFCMTTHIRVRIVCIVEGNRTACRCHDIQISEQQWNDYGINICRISTPTIRYADYILVTKRSRNMVTQARLRPLTTSPHHSSSASRADPLFFPRYICFAEHGFFTSFSLFLCLLFDCVEEGTLGVLIRGWNWGWVVSCGYGIRSGEAAPRAFRHHRHGTIHWLSAPGAEMGRSFWGGLFHLHGFLCTLFSFPRSGYGVVGVA